MYYLMIANRQHITEMVTTIAGETHDFFKQYKTVTNMSMLVMGTSLLMVLRMLFDRLYVIHTSREADITRQYDGR